MQLTVSFYLKHNATIAKLHLLFRSYNEIHWAHFLRGLLSLKIFYSNELIVKLLL